VTVLLAYRLRETPQTILTSPGGRVKKVWAGRLAGASLTSFMSALPFRERSIGGGTP